LEVNASRGDELVFDAAWSGLDGYLVLQGPSGQVVAENDDAGSGASSRIEYAVAQGGMHRLWVTGYQRNAQGGYEVELGCGTTRAPDLRASPVTVQQEAINVNDSLELSASVYNDGGSAAAATEVQFMLSTDAEIDPADTVLSTVSLASLGAGMSDTVSAQVTAPSTPGNYWAGICVEPVAGEVLTGNNCSFLEEATTQSTLQAAERSSRSKPEAFAKKGTLVLVSSGVECVSSPLSCGDSRSSRLTTGDCDQSPRGTGYVTEVYSFTGSTGDTVSLAATWSGVDGYLYLADPDGAVVSENDDFGGKGSSQLEYVLERAGTYRVWPTTVEQGAAGDYELQLNCNEPQAPDLMVTVPTVSSSTLRPGQQLTINTRVRNEGAGPADATAVQYLLAASATAAANDRLLGSGDVDALASGAQSNESLSVPLNVTPGRYWIRACVEQDVLELDTADNCQSVGPITVEATGEPLRINAGLNDAWYNPATDRQGFFINVFPDDQKMFLSWFTYDLSRPPSSVSAQLGDPGHRWLTAQGHYDRGVAMLDVVLTEGGVFDQATPPVQRDPLYGTLQVQFSDCAHGEIRFDLPAVGRSGTIPITRVSADNVKVCEEQVGALLSNTEPPPLGTAGFNFNPALNDAWYNPDTSGQGMFFNVFPDSGQVFLSWFTYDTERPPLDTPYQLGEPGHRWLTAQGPFRGDTAELTVYQTTGGVFNAGSPLPQSEPVGRITARFDDCNSGTVDYELEQLGEAGAMDLQRLARDTIPACEQASKGDDSSNEAVRPDKAVLENLCGSTVDWYFDWPEDAQAANYRFELYRNDSLVEWHLTRTRESAYHYQSTQAIDNDRLSGWQWRYTPVYTGLGKKARASQLFGFEVKPASDPCVD